MMKAERITHAFDPVFDFESRILILGTMPSPKSRELGFYYSHPRNRFWPVLAKIFGEEIPKTPEEKKMQRALLHFNKKENRAMVEKALKKIGRYDLIGVLR